MPQPPEQCLSRQAGIVRCCLNKEYLWWIAARGAAQNIRVIHTQKKRRRAGMKAVLAARRRFCFGVLLFLFVGDMHLWDGHVFVVDVFFLPGILLSGLLMCYLAGMYFRYGNIFIANMINRFLFLTPFPKHTDVSSKSSLDAFSCRALLCTAWFK
ncbi:MAG: hypothetical protein PUD46_05190 [Subdoligranulum sp.]|nr:hypothetical protein [Subdoligranulum sp.]